MKAEKYTAPTLVPLTVKIECGFVLSTEGFDKDNEFDPGWE